MDRKRYLRLDHELEKLTPEERQEGWHFCPDWDQMLVGPGMVEYEECCTCVLCRTSQ
jgi:hypothetical protein